MPIQPLLFKPWSMNGLHMRNRIVIAPMCTYAATNEDGKMSAFHEMHVGNMAASGVGLVILEATAVVPEGRITPRCCGLWTDEQAAEMKRVLERVRSYSATPIAIQLAHAGRKASCHTPYEDDSADTQIAPTAPRGWQTVAPSAIPYRATDNPPHALTREEIASLIEAYTAAARRAVAIGLDGIEMHFAHGYLCHEFLSPLSNHRTDAYGGSLENRMRFPLEVFKAVRGVVPAEVPVWVRISATDYVEGGWDVAQSIAFAKELQSLGCAAIHVSSGALSTQATYSPLTGYQLDFARQIRNAVSIPVIGVGLIKEPGEAEVALATRAADAIAVGRQILYNPHWPYYAAHVLGGHVDTPVSYWLCEPSKKVGIFDRKALAAESAASMDGNKSANTKM